MLTMEKRVQVQKIKLVMIAIIAALVWILESSHPEGQPELFLQCLGIFTGISIVFVLSVYTCFKIVEFLVAMKNRLTMAHRRDTVNTNRRG